MWVNGPYTHTTGRLKGRRYVNIVRADGTKTSKLYSRYLMESTLGRTLNYDETVDHIDEDPTNDDLSNLQIVSRSENAKKSAYITRPTEYILFTCPQCGKTAEKQARQIRHNTKQGKAGPFCGKSCAGKYKPKH